MRQTPQRYKRGSVEMQALLHNDTEYRSRIAPCQYSSLLRYKDDLCPCLPHWDQCFLWHFLLPHMKRTPPALARRKIFTFDVVRYHIFFRFYEEQLFSFAPKLPKRPLPSPRPLSFPLLSSPPSSSETPSEGHSPPFQHRPLLLLPPPPCIPSQHLPPSPLHSPHPNYLVPRFWRRSSFFPTPPAMPPLWEEE